MKKKFIIVGAGILGATTAYKLSKTGSEVIIIDNRDLSQATDAAAGVICPWLSQRRNKAWYQLARNGAKYYPELVNELEKDGETEHGYAKTGGLSLHHDEKKLIAMKDRAIKRREEAPEIGEVTLLNAQETRELIPFVNEGYSAVHISGAARLDGRAFRNALLRAAEKHGATLIHGNATLSPGGQEVYVENQLYEADKIIATCGAWMHEFLTPIGINFQSTGQKGQIIHLEMHNATTKDWPVLMPPTSQSIVPFDNHIVVGATHENDTGFDSRITVSGVHDILSKLIDVFPGLNDSTILEARVGFRPFTPGFLPVIGPLPGTDRILLANGLGSSGLTTGPYLGAQLAKLALGDELKINLEDYPVSGAIE